jgi:hypothetical protein
MKYHGFRVMMPALYNNLNKLTFTAEIPVEYGCVKNAMIVLRHISLVMISAIYIYLQQLNMKQGNNY